MTFLFQRVKSKFFDALFKTLHSLAWIDLITELLFSS